MTKQETIQYLTDLMATVQMAYFKGRMLGHPLWVHERDDDSAAISIDLYRFGGDGEPVCEGVAPCTVTFPDGTELEDGELFSMCYDPDNEDHHLTFLLDNGEDEDGDLDAFDVSPDQLGEETLSSIAAWLEAELRKEPAPVDDDELEYINRPSRKV